MLVHVDDVLISARDDERRDEIIKKIEHRFGELTKQIGKILNFIGMTFDYTVAKEVKILFPSHPTNFLLVPRINQISCYPLEIFMLIYGKGFHSEKESDFEWSKATK